MNDGGTPFVASDRLGGLEAAGDEGETLSGSEQSAGPDARPDLTPLASPDPAKPSMEVSNAEVEVRSPGQFNSRILMRRIELLLQLLAGITPCLALLALLGHTPLSENVLTTLIMLSSAIVVAWYVLARLRTHAKARHLSYVLPINILSFGSALAVIALLRLPYSISLFVVGAASAMVVSFLLAVRGRGIMKPHLIVLNGRAPEIRLEGAYLPAPPIDDLDALIRSGRRDWVLVADLHYHHSPRWETMLAQAALAGIPVYHFRQVAEMQTGQVKITHLSENDLGSLIPNIAYMPLKRLIDVMGALLMLPFCLVGFAVIAILIKIDSPGAAFFIQERVGFRGQTFRMIKFRTMRDRDPVEEAGAQREDAMTRSDDDRITKIGRFLRKTRIDELPQIFNILKGEMSLIGPRPEARALAEWYEAELPFYSYRHIVRPGITGWAQVNQGHVTDVSDVLGKLRYDFYYIKNISLWLDVLVTLKTVRVIVTGLGAK
jgi:lipopolysaccharide/colanic/teichoic acid biosynthesis glycosyltransferase